MSQCYPTQSSTRSTLLLPDTTAFTHEDLDFIINYGIKYRMGKELDRGEVEEE